MTPGGVAFLWDGSLWTRRDLGGAGSTRVLAARDGMWFIGFTSSWRWDGSSWSSLELPFSTGSTAAAAAARNGEVWLTSSSDELWHWNGAWESLVLPPVNISFISALDAGPTGDVWLAVQGTDLQDTAWRLDGAGWHDTSWAAGTWIHAIVARDPADVFAVTYDGVSRWDGTSWSLVFGESGMNDLWAGTPGDVWLAGIGGTTLHGDEGIWHSASGSAHRETLTGVWAADDSKAWATTWYGSLLEWDGTSWKGVDLGYGPLNGVWGSGPSDVWAIGSFSSHHFDGVTWEWLSRPGWSIWGSGSEDVWIGGCGLGHWDGSGWTEHTLPGVTDPCLGVTSISGTTPDDVWAVASQPPDYPLYHYDGAAWSRVSMSGVTGPQAVLAVAADDVWVAGISCAVAHWNGEAWSTSTIPRAVEAPVLVSYGDGVQLWGRGRNDIWYAGPLGNVAHFDGAGWTGMDTGSRGLITGIGGSLRTTWAVGEGGAILRYHPEHLAGSR